MSVLCLSRVICCVRCMIVLFVLVSCVGLLCMMRMCFNCCLRVFSCWFIVEGVMWSCWEVVLRVFLFMIVVSVVVSFGLIFI